MSEKCRNNNKPNNNYDNPLTSRHTNRGKNKSQGAWMNGVYTKFTLPGIHQQS